MTRQESIEMAKYIGAILLTRPYVLMSWGISKVHVIDGGLQFHTQGHLHTGIVTIVYNDGTDLFVVTFVKDDNPTEIERHEDIYFDTLIEFLDCHIEHTGENYRERVCEDNKLSQK